MGKAEKDAASKDGTRISGGQANAGNAADSAPGERQPNEDLRQRQEALLDEALQETFPASDPIAPKRIITGLDDQVWEPRHTPSGAPTDAAHQDAGDGTLTGSTPAGLTSDELRARSQHKRSDDAASE